MSTRKAAHSAYELRITLLEIDPPIWRRLQVPSTIKLSRLHDALQIVMGWTNSHLHHFEKAGKFWGVRDIGGFDDDLDLIDERRAALGDVLKTVGESLIYLYDFGDDWRHEVVLEKTVASHAPTKPMCLDGKRRCPPEDVGGPHGYQEFLEVIFQPGHEEFEHYRQWAGNEVHAEKFDLKAVNASLARIRWPVQA